MFSSVNTFIKNIQTFFLLVVLFTSFSVEHYCFEENLIYIMTFFIFIIFLYVSVDRFFLDGFILLVEIANQSLRGVFDQYVDVVVISLMFNDIVFVSTVIGLLGQIT